MIITMKKILFILPLLVLFACKEKTGGSLSTDVIQNPEAVDGEDQDYPEFTFKTDRIEFGDITQGEKVTKSFEFTNTGNADLLISSVSGSCGCTIANSWPKEPVHPGEGGKIEVTFNSEGKDGQQVKQITVLANTKPASTTVALAGNVIAPKK